MTLLFFLIGQTDYHLILILHFLSDNNFSFNMIHAKARKLDAQNPQEAASGYKDGDKSNFFGYEQIN